MKVEELISGLDRQALIAIDSEALEGLLAVAELVRGEDTCVAGWIRVLAVGELTVVQEETPDGDVLIRRMPSPEAAERFVEHRMTSYERMWNGCGCRIDYFGDHGHERSDPQRAAPAPNGSGRG